MSWLFKKKPKNTFTALVDIGTGTVTAAVIKLPNNETECPVIVWQHAITINFTSHPDQKRLLAKTLEAIKETAEALHTAWPNRIETVNCILASPWYEARTSITAFAEDKPFTLDERILASIKHDEVKAAATELPQPYYDIPDDQPIILEYDILSLKADGYRLKHLPNQPIKELELIQYSSIGSEAIISRLREVLIGAGHFRQVQFHSFIFSLAQAARKLAGEHSSFLVADVTGERADLGLVSEGVFLTQANFPMSGRGLVRVLPETKFPGLAQTSALTKAWADRQNEWLDNLNRALTRFKRETTLPKKIYLLTEPTGEKFFAQALKSAGFRPTILKPADWQKVCQSAPALTATRFDPGVMPLSLYLSGVAED